MLGVSGSAALDFWNVSLTGKAPVFLIEVG